MPVSDLHADITRIALKAAARYGFALAGGNALISHGIVDRLTQDVDLFTDQPDGVAAASTAVSKALRRAGYQVQPTTMGDLADVFYGMTPSAEWEVTSPAGERTILQMVQFERGHPPVRTDPDLGPVLAVQDLAVSKMVALLTRTEPRDYIDVAALIACYSQDQLIAMAREQEPGLTDDDVAQAGDQLDVFPDSMFARYRQDERLIRRMRRRLADWPRTARQD